jgi:ribosome assembly protein YihI (activator of Der GTPase)
MARGTKEKTYEQAEAAQRKAVRFLRDVVGDPEKADEIEALTVEEYADRKGFMLTNPATDSETFFPRSIHMADQNEETIDPETHDYDAEREGLMSWTKDQLADALIAHLEAGDRIWHAAQPYSDDPRDSDNAEDLADEVMGYLTDADSERFPEGDEEEGGQDDESEVVAA